MVHFLKYVEDSTQHCVEETEDVFLAKLHARIAWIKTSRDMEEKYMVLEEMLAREKEEGKEEGWTAGQAAGKATLLELIKSMTIDGRSSELERLSQDPVFLQEMLQKYHLDV